MENTVKTYSKAELLDLLKKQIGSNENKAISALLKVYANQTASEQKDGYTKEFNGVGFTGVDSDFLSSLAERVKTKGTNSLSAKQKACLLKTMPKYARQLLEQSFEAGNFIKVGRGWAIKK